MDFESHGLNVNMLNISSRHLRSIVFFNCLKLLWLSCLINNAYSLAWGRDTSRQIAPSYDFKFISDQWMTMQDGTRLAVSYWLPEPKSTGERFPVVLEVLPYRKDDSHYTHDYQQNAYFARRGIACVRVDVRGTGSSYGKVPDREYSDEELADLPVIIKKLAKQPWSNGNVGMQGISWSAFNSIMTAMQRPAHLKGILVAHGSDDLYGNDIHNIDGALHLDIFTLEIDTDNSLPRSPDYDINAQYFADRFDQKPWIITYLQHQRDSSFWHHKRSLQTGFSAIKIPVYAFAGLLDGYRDFAVQMLDHLKAPLRVNIGPQSHAWPDGDPGPKYEWRQLAVRWWYLERTSAERFYA
jgi:putative CocE/NonD family hydrolase